MKTVFAFFDVVLLFVIECSYCVLGSSGLELLLCFNSKYNCITNLKSFAMSIEASQTSITFHRILEIPSKFERFCPISGSSVGTI